MEGSGFISHYVLVKPYLEDSQTSYLTWLSFLFFIFDEFIYSH